MKNVTRQSSVINALLYSPYLTLLSNQICVFLSYMQLRAENEIVTEFDDSLKQIAKEMLLMMYAADGVGLAAPQVRQPASQLEGVSVNAVL